MYVCLFLLEMEKICLLVFSTRNGMFIIMQKSEVLCECSKATVLLAIAFNKKCSVTRVHDLFHAMALAIAHG